MTADRTTGFTDIDRRHWSLRYLPAWARPYGRLARWDRPIGGWLLMLPCWWSAALGSGHNWPNLIGWMSLFGVAILFKLNKFAGGVALLSVVLIAIYPTMKRLTSWPQLVLGLAFNWG